MWTSRCWTCETNMWTMSFGDVTRRRRLLQASASRGSCVDSAALNSLKTGWCFFFNSFFSFSPRGRWWCFSSDSLCSDSWLFYRDFLSSTLCSFPLLEFVFICLIKQGMITSVCGSFSPPTAFHHHSCLRFYGKSQRTAEKHDDSRSDEEGRKEAVGRVTDWRNAASMSPNTNKGGTIQAQWDESIRIHPS